MNNTPRDRQGARRGNANNSPPAEDGLSWWKIGLGVAAGVATVAGGIYVLNQSKQPQEHRSKDDSDQSDDESIDHVDITMDDIRDAVSRSAVPCKPQVNNLNSLLNDIHVRYIAIKKEEFSRRYNVFKNVFDKLHNSMKAVDSYYERYSSRCVFKSEEFKMYIVIRIPVNMHADPQNPEDSDIIIEPKHAGFVQLRAGVQYKKSIIGDGHDFHINKTAFLWLDDRSYILRSKFISWFQSVVDRALNKIHKSVRIDGTEYKITTSFKDGAYVLWITNSAGFRLEVDLVPTVRFPEERWLGTSKAYRDIPSDCRVDYWMVVPKPNKFGANSFDEDRSWHVDLHEQEKKFIHNTFHLRQGMRLLKKLCVAQQMVHLENYHIETLFLWKCLEFKKSFWQNDVATVFIEMLREFCKALEAKEISFFWKKCHNLIEPIPGAILTEYVRKLTILITELEDRNNYMSAAEYLLTPSEYAEYEGLF